jgi:hypothetical protein
MIIKVFNVVLLSYIIPKRRAYLSKSDLMLEYTLENVF